MLSEISVFEAVQSQSASLPDKLNFKIGEAAKLLGARPHALRYWEREFPLLKPKKMAGSRRIYFKKDMEILFLIKTLLHKEKLSVEGARKRLPAYYKKLSRQKLQAKKAGKKSRSAEKKLVRLLQLISEMKAHIENDSVEKIK